MQQSHDWARATTQRVAVEIRSRRGTRSVQWLSDRTANCGHRISRSRIDDLERGNRGGVLGVAELLVLAAALEMPPALLLYPVHAGGEVAPLPDQNMNPWNAYEALTGEIVLVLGDPLPNGAELVGPNIALRTTAPAVAAYRRHKAAADQYRRHAQAADEYRHYPQSDSHAERASQDAVNASLAAAEAWLRTLASIRREMAAQGWALPQLDLDVALALEQVTDNPGTDQ